MNSERAEELLGWQPIPDAPRRFHRSLAKAGTYLDRCVVDGDRSYQGRLIDMLDRIVADEQFARCPGTFRIAVLNRTGIAHNWRGGNQSSVDDLRSAVRLFTAGLQLVSDGSIEQVRMDCNLAGTLRFLFQLSDDPEAIPSGIRHARRAVSQVEHGTTLAALCHSTLANLLRVTFILGDITVLNEAIEQAERAVAAPSPVDHRGMLADLLFDRYELRGDLDDLNRAIDLYRQELQDRGPTTYPAAEKTVHGRLGALLRFRYLRTKSWSDLDEAVRLVTESLHEQPNSAGAMSSLGNVLLTRYHARGDTADLFTAVDLQVNAVAAADVPHWGLPDYHNNAGNALAEAARATGDPELGGQAIEHYRAALRLIPDSSPQRASWQYNLGRVLQSQSELTVDDALADAAKTAYRQAVRLGLDTAPEWALSAARLWGGWAAEHGDWDEATEAYGHAIEAAQHLFRTQLFREDKETWLADVQGLSAEAARAMFQAGHQEAAVVALDAGRGLQLAEALQRDRVELDRLVGTAHDELVHRYRLAAEELDYATRGSAAPADVRRCRDTLDSAIEAIREIGGYERFLRTPVITDIHRAVPSNSVILYLAAAEDAGIALAVHPDGRVEGTTLAAMTGAAVRQRVRALLDTRRSLPTQSGPWEGALDAITRWAWSEIMAPALSLTGNTDQIILVPSGMLTMLPLHAAWTPAPGAPSNRRYLLDDTTITYSPNSYSLAFTERVAAQIPAERLVVVVDPRPTSHPPIGYARAESAWSKHWFPQATTLEGPRANSANLVAAWGDAQVLHFISHGHADPSNPLNSALVLADDHDLTLREIFDLRPMASGPRHQARLAVLSACDTDRPGTGLPDEVVSLPSGLIQAGFAGVIATQWVIRSEAVSLLMARFYQLWKNEHHPPAVALRAAQKWLRDTTNMEKVNDLRNAVAPSVDQDMLSLIRNLQLRDPDARPYLHPSDWAGMSYHGS
ncbi:CHAT domain-containing protein [Actinophytocola sediminis]